MAQQYGQVPGGGRPWGDIFTVNTPYIDRSSQQLYQEQKLREVKRQQQQKALDDQMEKDLAKIRRPDAEDFVNAYQEYKATYNKYANQPGGITPQQQYELLEKKAKPYKILNESIAQKEKDNLLLGRHDYENLNDDFYDVISKRTQTPLSKMDDEIKNYNPVYPGDKYKLAADDLVKSKGEKSKNVIVAGDKEATYEFFGNTPQQTKQYILSRMADRDANKYYRNKLMNLPPDELTKTKEQYDAIPESQFELMGYKKPKMDYEHLDNNADTMATYVAMKSAIENIPRKTKEDLTDAAKIAAQGQKQKEVAAFAAGLKDRYAKGLYDYKHAGTSEEKDSIVKRLLKDSYDAGKDDFVYLNGKLVPAKKITTLKGVGKLHEITYDKGAKATPQWYVTKDMEYVVPRYPGETSKGQEPIPMNTFLSEMGQSILTKSNNQSEVDEILDDDVPYVPPTMPSKTKSAKRPPLDAFIKKNK